MDLACSLYWVSSLTLNSRSVMSDGFFVAKSIRPPIESASKSGVFVLCTVIESRSSVGTPSNSTLRSVSGDMTEVPLIATAFKSEDIPRIVT